MRSIATFKPDDDEEESEVIRIYAVLSDGLYSVVLSNGNDTGFRSYFSMDELERSVEAAWGNWYTFRWNLD